MKKVFKPLLTLILSALTLFALLVVYLSVVVDPNDFKPEIKSAAASQGLELSLDGDLSWQFLPRIGVVAKQVEFAYSPLASGKIGELGLSVNWSELLNLDFSAKRLPVGSVEISDGTIQLAELAPNTSPLLLKQVNAAVKNVSLAGQSFPLRFSAELLSGIAVAIEANIALNLDLNSPQPEIKKLAVSDLDISVDQLKISGQFNAENNFATAQGGLRSNQFNLKRLINKLGKSFPALQLPEMAGADALTAISWNSTFNNNISALSTTDTELSIDGQSLTIASKIDHSVNNLMLRVSGKQFDLTNYLSNSQAADSSQQQNGALFAPLALPFALWLGQSQMELSLDKLILGDFDADHIYLNLFGNQKVLRLSSFNADIFSGQVNATGRLDMRPKTPTFNVQTSANNIDLQTALSAIADSSDISGRLSLETAVQGAGNDLDKIVATLKGGGQMSITNPNYAAINAEQLFCNAAAMFGSTGAKSDWPKGTQFETVTGRFTVNDGKLLIEDLKTATGNIAIASRGTVKLTEKRFGITANARVNGATTSASGCSINSRLQNRSLPFVCSGSFAENGKTSCKPDDNLVKDMLKDSAYKKLGEKLFKTPVTVDGEQQQSGQQENEQQSDPLKSLLKGFLDKNLSR